MVKFNNSTKFEEYELDLPDGRKLITIVDRYNIIHEKGYLFCFHIYKGKPFEKLENYLGTFKVYGFELEKAIEQLKSDLVHMKLKLS